MQSKSFLKRNLSPQMKKIILPAIAVLFALSTSAQYSTLTLPAALKEGANMVVRMSETTIDIKSKNSVQVKRKFAYTILNSTGDEHAALVVHYDKLRKVQEIDGKLYDGFGIKIKETRKGDVKDQSATEESNLADNLRVKYHNFKHTTYPYTVEYEVVTEQDGLFYLPMWMPVVDERVAVESSKLLVIADAGYEVRFKAMNYPAAPQVTESKKQKQYSWSISNYGAIKREPYAPGIVELTPSVFLAPSDFELQKYSGAMHDWKSYGLFMYQLNAGRDILPANIKQQVQDIAARFTSNKEKTEALFRFMQKNTRYISVQLGIGGWQTFDANYVATNGYGDCKALTNYMHAILKEAGINSYPALIRAGQNEWNILADFSSTQFNHVILCVPAAKDTMWLECTSQTEMPGYLGAFTGNRKALLVTPEGGVLVNTPSYSEKENLQLRKIKASVSADGKLNASINTVYYAMQQDRLNSLLNHSSKDDVSNYIRTKFSLSYDVDNFAHKQLEGNNPGIEENITLKVNHFASVSGKRLFINPNIVSVSSFRLKDAGSRKYDFDMQFPFTDVDTVQIDIPTGLKPESLPPDLNIRTAGMQYSSSVKIEDNKIYYTRFYKQEKLRIPAAKAQELADFFEKIYKADHARIVFVKDETSP